jgi:mevalonate kinase
MSHTAYAPGKLILMGEHAVVYGHPAIAMAIDRGTTVTLTDRAGPTALDQPWVDDGRLPQALHTVLPAEGVGVIVDSNLPVGVGMGSSAALAVALARASLSREGRAAERTEVDARAFAVERIFHGNPSGIDHTVSMRGGALQYQRTDAGSVFEAVHLPPLPIVVINSGSAGDTSAQVAKVGSRRHEIDGYLVQMGELLKATRPALEAGNITAIGQAWHENHLLLRAIGVSTTALDEIVQVALDAGAAGAKLAGAGGGGVVIAIATQPRQVIAAATAAGWTAFEVQSHN